MIFTKQGRTATLGDKEIKSGGAKSSKMGGSLKNNNNNSQDPLGKSHIRAIRMIRIRRIEYVLFGFHVIICVRKTAYSLVIKRH